MPRPDPATRCDPRAPKAGIGILFRAPFPIVSLHSAGAGVRFLSSPDHRTRSPPLLSRLFLPPNRNPLRRRLLWPPSRGIREARAGTPPIAGDHADDPNRPRHGGLDSHQEANSEDRPHALRPGGEIRSSGRWAFWVRGVTMAAHMALVGAGLIVDLSDVKSIRVNDNG